VSIDHEIQASEFSSGFVDVIQDLLSSPPPGEGEGLRLVEAHPIQRRMCAVPRDPSAVHNGPAPEHWAVVPLAAWFDPGDDEAYQRWVVDGVSRLRSAAEEAGTLLDCFGTNVMGSAVAAYGAALPKLQDLKRQWDPANVFRANLNIRPDSVSGT
jgi:FAD/FMN-containing dehydrogenase